MTTYLQTGHTYTFIHPDLDRLKEQVDAFTSTHAVLSIGEPENNASTGNWEIIVIEKDPALTTSWLPVSRTAGWRLSWTRTG